MVCISDLQYPSGTEINSISVQQILRISNDILQLNVGNHLILPKNISRQINTVYSDGVFTIRTSLILNGINYHIYSRIIQAEGATVLLSIPGINAFTQACGGISIASSKEVFIDNLLNETFKHNHRAIEEILMRIDTDLEDIDNEGSALSEDIDNIDLDVYSDDWFDLTNIGSWIDSGYPHERIQDACVKRDFMYELASAYKLTENDIWLSGLYHLSHNAMRDSVDCIDENISLLKQPRIVKNMSLQPSEISWLLNPVARCRTDVRTHQRKLKAKCVTEFTPSLLEYIRIMHKLPCFEILFSIKDGKVEVRRERCINSISETNIKDILNKNESQIVNAIKDLCEIVPDTQIFIEMNNREEMIIWVRNKEISSLFYIDLILSAVFSTGIVRRNT